MFVFVCTIVKISSSALKVCHGLIKCSLLAKNGPDNSYWLVL